MPTRKKEDYTVAWICALPVPEWQAARMLLDEEHEDLNINTRHQYVYGTISKHNVVLGCLPETQYGLQNAASVASEILSVFTSVRFGVLVGIGGGVPHMSLGLRLGDVVVSQPSPKARHGGVLQYDFGKAIDGKVERRNFLNMPPTKLLSALGKTKSDPKDPSLRFTAWKHAVQLGTRIASFSRPKDNQYQIFGPRDNGPDPEAPVIHFGTIASGNMVIADGNLRDEICNSLGSDVLCFETEAAGLMNEFPCIVVRGVCDFCDSTKNDDWQGFAAGSSAAWTKAFLAQITPEVINDLPSIEQSRDMLLKWIGCDDSSQQLDENFRPWVRGTGAWFHELELVSAWLRGQSKWLLCIGNPGVGKSVIAAQTARQLRKAAVRDHSVVSYLCCDYTRATSQTAVTFMRSLLRQLAAARRGCLEPAQFLFNENQVKALQPSLEELQDALKEAVAYFDSVHIIIDALDECVVDVRNELMFLVQELCRQRGIYVMATSRPNQEIQEEFPHSSIVRIEASQNDIGLFLQHRMKSLPALIRRNEALISLIMAEIPKAASGMFLLAWLQVESLKGATSPAQVKKALAALPSNYSDIYDDTMIRVKSYQSSERSALALDVLKWVYHAKQPLTVTELQHAVAVKLGEVQFADDELSHLDIILSVCFGLVELEPASNIVQLVHYTTKEYLGDTNGTKSALAHLELGGACITYLAAAADTDRTIYDWQQWSTPAKGLFRYAALHWTEHLLHAERDMKEAEMTAFYHSIWNCFSEPLFLDYIDRAIQILSFRRTARTNYLDSEDMTNALETTKCHIAAFCGLTVLLRLFTLKDADIDSSDVRGRTPLAYACAMGHVDCVKVLLECGRCDITSESDDDLTPLHYAISQRQWQAMTMVLDSGKVNLLDNRFVQRRRTPLLVATATRHTGAIEAVYNTTRSLWKQVARAHPSSRMAEERAFNDRIWLQYLTLANDLKRADLADSESIFEATLHDLQDLETVVPWLREERLSLLPSSAVCRTCNAEGIRRPFDYCDNCAYHRNGWIREDLEWDPINARCEWRGDSDHH